MLAPNDHNVNNASNNNDTFSDDQSDDDEDSQWPFNLAGIEKP